MTERAERNGRLVYILIQGFMVILFGITMYMVNRIDSRFSDMTTEIKDIRSSVDGKINDLNREITALKIEKKDTEIELLEMQIMTLKTQIKP